MDDEPAAILGPKHGRGAQLDRTTVVAAAHPGLEMFPVAAGLLVPWGIDLPVAVGAIAMSASTIIVAANAQLPADSGSVAILRPRPSRSPPPYAPTKRCRHP